MKKRSIKPPEWDLAPNGPRLRSNPNLRWDLANQKWGEPTQEPKTVELSATRSAKDPTGETA